MQVLSAGMRLIIYPEKLFNRNFKFVELTISIKYQMHIRESF